MRLQSRGCNLINFFMRRSSTMRKKDSRIFICGNYCAKPRSFLTHVSLSRYLNGIGTYQGRALDVVLSMLVGMAVHMSGMMPVMIQAGGCAISLSGIRMARVQRVYRLQVMVMIVNVIQPAVSPSIGVGRRRFT